MFARLSIVLISLMFPALVHAQFGMFPGAMMANQCPFPNRMAPNAFNPMDVEQFRDRLKELEHKQIDKRQHDIDLKIADLLKQIDAHKRMVASRLYRSAARTVFEHMEHLNDGAAAVTCSGGNVDYNPYNREQIIQKCFPEQPPPRQPIPPVGPGPGDVVPEQPPQDIPAPPVQNKGAFMCPATNTDRVPAADGAATPAPKADLPETASAPTATPPAAPAAPAPAKVQVEPVVRKDGPPPPAPRQVPPQADTPEQDGGYFANSPFCGPGGRNYWAEIFARPGGDVDDRLCTMDLRGIHVPGTRSDANVAGCQDGLAKLRSDFSELARLKQEKDVLDADARSEANFDLDNDRGLVGRRGNQSNFMRQLQNMYRAFRAQRMGMPMGMGGMGMNGMPMGMGPRFASPMMPGFGGNMPWYGAQNPGYMNMYNGMYGGMPGASLGGFGCNGMNGMNPMFHNPYMMPAMPPWANGMGPAGMPFPGMGAPRIMPAMGGMGMPGMGRGGPPVLPFPGMGGMGGMRPGYPGMMPGMGMGGMPGMVGYPGMGMPGFGGMGGRPGVLPMPGGMGGIGAGYGYGAGGIPPIAGMGGIGGVGGRPGVLPMPAMGTYGGQLGYMGAQLGNVGMGGLASPIPPLFGGGGYYGGSGGYYGGLGVGYGAGMGGIGYGGYGGYGYGTVGGFGGFGYGGYGYGGGSPPWKLPLGPY